MGDGLAHAGSVFVNFRRYARDPKEYGFRWVDIKKFRFSADSMDDEALLGALIRHEQFRDDYAGGGILPEGSRHGPYWLRLINPGRYEPISRNRAVQIVREWLDPFWAAPTELEEDLRQEVFARLATSDGIYYLSELGDEAIHDWGRVHEQFHEFVLIDRPAGQITLVVAADD